MYEKYDSNVFFINGLDKSFCQCTKPYWPPRISAILRDLGFHAIFLHKLYGDQPKPLRSHVSVKCKSRRYTRRKHAELVNMSASSVAGLVFIVQKSGSNQIWLLCALNLRQFSLHRLNCQQINRALRTRQSGSNHPRYNYAEPRKCMTSCSYWISREIYMLKLSITTRKNPMEKKSISKAHLVN